jgi:hypothetical protein
MFDTAFLIDESHLHIRINFVLSRVGVNYKTGFGLDDWIYCTLYTQLSAAGNTALSDLHIFQFALTHALVFLVVTSCILATVL